MSKSGLLRSPIKTMLLLQVILRRGWPDCARAPCLHSTLFACLAFLLCCVPAAGAPAGTREQALAYIGQGTNAYRMGDLAEAARRWGEAVQLCRLTGDTATETDALARRGEALGLMGQLRAAETDLRQALAQAEKLDDSAQLAAISGALGNIYFQAHDFAAARPLLERSLSLARATHRDTIIAASANNLGNVALASGDAAGAEPYYDISIRAAWAAGDTALRGTALTNKARVKLREGHETAALDDLETALRLEMAQPASADVAYATVAIGRLALQEPARSDVDRRRAIADVAFQRAESLAGQLRDWRIASLAEGYMAEMRAEQERQAEAADLATQAVFHAQKAGATDLLYRWEWLQGRMERAAGHQTAAIQLYRRAVNHLQEIRQDIPVDYTDGRSSFREIMGPLYLGLADMLLRAAAEPGNRGNQPELLSEARDTVELLKTAEVRDYFKDQCLVPLEASAAAASRASNRAETRQRTATLYPIIFPDRIELLAAAGDQQQRVAVPITEINVTEKAHELRRELETLGTREFLGDSQQMYDWLIRPVLPFLRAHDVSTLVVVPDGPLRSIPFAALHDGRDFLVAQFSVATELGLTLTDPKPLWRQPISALLSGLSVPTQGYPGLPFVAKELSVLQTVAQNSTVLENQAFRVQRIETALRARPYSVMHIASHAQFSSDPAKTFILAYDGRLTLGELENAVKGRRWDENPLELLTLSACQTAVGDDRAALGLAGVAIKAGARSAVASLWFINDEAASRIVTQFYQELQKPGVSKAQALQRAQLALMRDRRFRHPGYWAPFLVIGNWL